MENKVLFTASTYSHILNFHLPYIRWFQQQGWTVHVACGGEPASIPNTDRVIPVPFQKSMGSPDNFKAAAMLRRMIRAENYTLISTHTSLAAFFTRFAVKGMRDRPLVVNTVHGYLFDESTPTMKRKILLTAERFVAAQTDLLMTMNRWDYDLARREKLGKRVVHIPGMGVDFSRLDQAAPEAGAQLRTELGIPQDAFVLIYPAEFSTRKSQKVLLRAMALLSEYVVLVLPGQGALLEDCRRLAAKRGVARRVIFPGQIRDMGPWYAMADAAVTASRSEGLPFNVMEAMHRGLPVVASRVKGHTDLIQNGVTGLLYSYGSTDACATAIRHLVESVSLRQKLGRNAQEEVEQYDIGRVIPEVTRRYSELLTRPIKDVIYSSE